MDQSFEFPARTKPKSYLKKILLVLAILAAIFCGICIHMYPWLVWIINILLAGSIANAIYHDGEHKSIPLVVCAIILWIIALLIVTWQALIGGLLLSMFVFVVWLGFWVKKKCE